MLPKRKGLFTENHTIEEYFEQMTHPKSDLNTDASAFYVAQFKRR